MFTSIATCSISGTLEAKLRAIAHAGFDGVEIFENDLLTSQKSAREAGAMLRYLGLKCTLFQPFRDFEGMPDSLRPRVFDRMERKFDLMEELGTDLLLVCSNVSPVASNDRGRIVADFRELGERAQRRNLRVGYEALAWGLHVWDHRDAWSVVREVDHPSIGLILENVPTTLRRAEGLQIGQFTQPIGPGEMRIPSVVGIGGSLIYFMEAGSEAEVWDTDFVAVTGAGAQRGAGLLRVDHVAQTMHFEEMLSWLLYYLAFFDVSKAPLAQIADPLGLVQSQAVESAEGGLRMLLNGSSSQQTLSARFLQGFHGSGIQHIALSSGDILSSARRLRELGLATLPIPKNYYEDLEARFGLDASLLAQLAEFNILYDRDTDGEYFQLVSRAFAKRFFFEIVERRGYRGFGAANAPIRLAAQSRYREDLGEAAAS